MLIKNNNLTGEKIFLVAEIPELVPAEETPVTNKKLIAVILFSFLATFVAARLIVYLTVTGAIPNLFLYVKGVHIHHFTYGVIILAVAGLYLLLKRPAPATIIFKLMAIWYGIGLGLTFDEFGMWIHLQDNYWIRQSYDAIIIITLLLFNGIYYAWLVKGLREIWKIILFILRIPKKIGRIS